MRRAVAIAIALSWGAACTDSGQSGSENELKPDSSKPSAGSSAEPDSGRQNAGSSGSALDGGVGGRPSNEPPPDDGTNEGPLGQPIRDRDQLASAACDDRSLGEVID